MAKRWRIHPHDPARIAALQRDAAIPAVVAQLLICRGVTDPMAARSFLEPKLSALAIRNCCRAARKPRSASLPPSPPESESSFTAITTWTA